MLLLYKAITAFALYAQTLKNQSKEVSISMVEVRNLNKKRIGDMSDDERLFVIKIKDCVTRITVTPDGTLNITHERVETVA